MNGKAFNEQVFVRVIHERAAHDGIAHVTVQNHIPSFHRSTLMPVTATITRRRRADTIQTPQRERTEKSRGFRRPFTPFLDSVKRKSLPRKGGTQGIKRHPEAPHRESRISYVPLLDFFSV